MRRVAMRRVAVRSVAVRRVAMRSVAVRSVAVRIVAVRSTRPAIGAVGAQAADVVLISGAAIVAITVIGIIARVRALSHRASQLEEEQSKCEHRVAE